MAWEIHMNTLVELAGSTKIMLFSGIQIIFRKRYFSQGNVFAKENEAFSRNIYSRMFYLSKWNHPN
jgi:hypothetical protein